MSVFIEDHRTTSAVVVSTWLILIFIANVAVKLTFAFFLVLEWICNKIIKKRSKILLVSGFLATGLVLVIFIYGATIGRSRLRVEYVTIYSDQLPKSFDGFTIAQFSDIHIGNMSKNNPLVDDLVRKINDLDPDLIVQSGDIINLYAEELTEERIVKFSKLKAPVYAVLGNHDLGYYMYREIDKAEQSVRTLLHKMDDMGWTLLQNKNLWLYRGDDSIALAGVGYPNNGIFGGRSNRYSGSNLKAAFEGIKESDFSVLISHTPSIFDSIPKYATPNLTMSGHVHSMQFKINIGEWKWSPAKILYHTWSGLWNKGEYNLYVNDGCGYTLCPLRIGTRPEITFYKLKTDIN